MNVQVFAISWLSAAFATAILFAETSPGDSVPSKQVKSPARSFSALQSDLSAPLCPPKH